MNAQARQPRRGHLDANQLAASIVAEATDETTTDTDAPEEEAEEAPSDDGKNPAAVALGRLGGKVGGPARAKALSARRRTAIAKKAAKARWEKADQ